MESHSQAVLCSVVKGIELSKVTNQLNFTEFHIYDIIMEYIEEIKNDPRYVEIRSQLIELADRYETLYPDSISDNKEILADVVNNDGSPVGNPSSSNVVFARDFEVSKFSTTYATSARIRFDEYKFKRLDFLDNYRDSNDNKFYSLVIFRDDLDDMTLRFSKLNVTNNYNQNVVPIEILYDEIENWSLVTGSTSNYFHQIRFKFIDRIGIEDFSSPIRTLTLNRRSDGNQPATIGDLTFTVDHNTVTTFTLAMVTSSLAPPYNDPDGDLLDAVRIIEISTANKGVLTLNDVPVTPLTIVTREQLQAGALQHKGSTFDDIWADSFTFQGRDEGNGTWVD